MECTNCGAPIHLDAGRGVWTCRYCKSLYYPEKNEDGVRVLTQSSGLTCPVCAMELAQAAIDEHKIFYCQHCRGSLIPVGEFVLLLEELRARQGGEWSIAPRADPVELQRTIRCPHCQRAMDTHFYGGPGNVVIDDCAACELNWLDSGELARIVRAPETLD